MHEHGLTPRQLRWMLGVKSRSSVLRYLTGERTPSARVMHRIEQITEGRVTRSDFRDPSPPRCARVVVDRFGQPHYVFPWTHVERDRLKGGNDNRPRQPGLSPPERPGRLGEAQDEWPFGPLRRAMEVLGTRVRLTRRGRFLLDGRASDAKRVVMAANVELRRRGQPPIPYPGVDPLL